MSPTFALEARGLVKRYGETTALGGVDLAVSTGTVTAVLGPNGAGKTTAVRILTTLTEPDEGEATVAGFDVRTQAGEVRRRIGLAAQDATVDPLLTGRENLVMMGELHQLSRKSAQARAVELLGEFSLTDGADVVDYGRIIAQGDCRTLKREVGGDHVHVVVIDPERIAEAAAIVGRIAGTEPRVDTAVRAVTAPIQPVMFVLMFAYARRSHRRTRRRQLPRVPHGRDHRPDHHLHGLRRCARRGQRPQEPGGGPLRSLPIANGAVLTGHAIASLLKTLLPIALMTVCGFIIGWRIRSGVLDALGGYLLLFAFAFAMIWIGVVLGSIVATPEGVMGVAFSTMFPITFIASTFVPTETMPGLLKHFAEWNPVTTLSDAVRIAFGNPNTPLQPGDPWPIQHPFIYTMIWVVVIVVVCAPLSVRLYRRSLSK